MPGRQGCGRPWESKPQDGEKLLKFLNRMRFVFLKVHIVCSKNTFGRMQEDQLMGAGQGIKIVHCNPGKRWW